MIYGEGLISQGTVLKPRALTKAGDYTYTYDPNGNMTVGKNKTLTYDIENRLLQVNELGKITSFVYDGDGGRVKKSTETTSTTYIGSLFEKDSDGKTRKHIFAGANRVATVSLRGSEAPEAIYYHSDHLGSSSIITDSTGAQVQHIEYTPYGTIAQNEGTDLVKHKFTGKELDNTGLYFYGARYYDPEIGRFISADTIVQAPYDPQTLNRYSYCSNNPINYVDPTGHFWFIPLIMAAIKAVAAFAVLHPVIFGAIVGTVFNTTMNASNIHNFGNFMAYAAIGAISGAAGGGVGAGIGGFWGTVAGSFTGGFISGASNAGYSGANLSQSLKSGLITGGVAAGTAAVLYGAAKVVESMASSAPKASSTRAETAGVKTPVGQQGQGSPAVALETDVSSAASETQISSSNIITEQKELPTGAERAIFIGKDPIDSGIKALGVFGKALGLKAGASTFSIVKVNYNYEMQTQWAKFNLTWHMNGDNQVLMNKTMIHGTENWKHSYYFKRATYEPAGMPPEYGIRGILKK